MDTRLRILAIIKAKKTNTKSFSEQVGIPYPTLVKQLSGDRPISFDVVMAILNQVPEVSAEWLLREIGTMFKDESIGDKKETDFIDVFLKGICNSDNQKLDAAQEAIASVKRLRNLGNPIKTN